MSKAEAFEVNFGENKRIAIDVNFSKGDAIQVPVSINSLDAEKIGKEVGDRITEKLDETVLANVAKESTLLTESQRIQDEVRNIDLSPIENKVQEGVNTLSSKIDNIDPSAVENKVQEESAAIQAKIDNIKLPEIDTSALAKQGENQDATNTAIYALLSQFGESVLQEAVTVICNCAEDIAWEEYGVVITYADGTSQSLPMSENGTCSFSVKIGQEYSVQLPVIGAYIAPTLKTYTASTSSRQIYWSYVTSGAFGVDELGRRYTLEQINSLEDKSIIKYVGYTNSYLENSPRDDGGVGNGFMLKIGETVVSKSWASNSSSFSDELLPKATDTDSDFNYCNGEAYTRYIIAEGTRLGVSTPAATYCNSQIVNINKTTYNGFLISLGQAKRLSDNRSLVQAIFDASGNTMPPITNGSVWYTSNRSKTNGSACFWQVLNFNRGHPNYFSDRASNILVVYPLPK